MASEFINFYLRDKKEALKEKWKIISFLEEEFAENTKKELKILKTQSIKNLKKDILKHQKMEGLNESEREKSKGYYSISKLKEILKKKNNVS